MLGSGDVNNPVSLATAALSSHTHKATSVPGARLVQCAWPWHFAFLGKKGK